MMDELELLKKDWKKREDQHPKLSYEELYKMIWKRSSSISKWILTISILEFVLPHLLYLVPGAQNSLEVYDKLGIKNAVTILFSLSYLVIIYFIYQFYRRYREISSLDSSKELMEKIIRTRRTVKHYVIFSLSVLFVTCMMVLVGIYLTNDLMAVFEIPAGTKDVSPEKFKYTVMASMAVVSVLLVVVMGGIYFLLYGLLLRKLKRNYNELQRLEV